MSEVGVHQKDTDEGQKSFGHVKAPPQKRRAAVRNEAAESQDYVWEFLRMSHLNQNMEAKNEQNMEELSFVPNAVGLQVLRNCGYFVRRRRSAND